MTTPRQQEFDFTSMTAKEARSHILHFPFRHRGKQATWDGEAIYLNGISDELAIEIAGEMKGWEGKA